MIAMSCLGALERDQRFGFRLNLSWGRWGGGVGRAHAMWKALLGVFTRTGREEYYNVSPSSFFSLPPKSSFSLCTRPVSTYSPCSPSSAAGVTEISVLLQLLLNAWGSGGTHPDQPCPGKMKNARLDGRALRALEVGLAAASATGEIGWGSSCCCCRRKLPAASIAHDDWNEGIGLQEVRHQWFTFVVCVTTSACLLWTKQREWWQVWCPSTAHDACTLGHVRHPSVRGFPPATKTADVKANLYL